MNVFRPTVFLLSAILSLPSAALAQAERPAAEAPPETAQVQAMNRLYAELLEVVKANQVDPRRDTLRAVQTKRQAVAAALDGFARAAQRLVFEARHLGMDYARFAEDTFPRLSGRVVKVGANAKWPDLAAAMVEIRPGDLVLLGPGRFELPRVDGEWRDIALVGLGAEQTTLALEVDQARRLRVAAVTVDCRNKPFLDLRNGGSVQIKNCVVTNFNSGAGGSNAVFGNGASVLAENTVFNGLPGRAAKRMHGDAFDLRGSFFLYVRACTFQDTGEIVRATSFCVADRCQSTGVMRGSGISASPGGFLLTRGDQVKIRGEVSATFEVSTDDREVVKHLQDAKSPLSKEARDAVASLGLRDNPRYWATLLHHPDQEVRFLASGRLAALLRGAMPSLKIDPKVAAQVPAKWRAQFIAELRSSRALRWLEKNESRLKWSEKLRAFEVSED